MYQNLWHAFKIVVNNLKNCPLGERKNASEQQDETNRHHAASYLLVTPVELLREVLFDLVRPIFTMPYGVKEQLKQN